MIRTDTELLSKTEELKYKILHNLKTTNTTENIDSEIITKIQDQINNLSKELENLENLDPSIIDLSNNQSVANLINQKILFFQDYKEIKFIKKIKEEDLFTGKLNDEDLENAVVIDIDINEYLQNKSIKHFILKYNIIKESGFKFEDFIFNIFSDEEFLVYLNDNFISIMDNLKNIEDEIFLSFDIDIDFTQINLDNLGKPLVKIKINFISIL